MKKHTYLNRMMETYAIQGQPHGWIQWKGTDVCMDVHCRCGEHLHLDGDFAYFLTCKHCGTTYATVPYVHLMELKPEEMDEVTACHYTLYRDEEDQSQQEKGEPE